MNSPVIQDFDSELTFTFDAWTSPNHKAFLTFAVHLHHEGIPLSFILDVIEVAESHTGKTMADVFHAVLNEFGILEKVSKNAWKIQCRLTRYYTASCNDRR